MSRSKRIGVIIAIVVVVAVMFTIGFFVWQHFFTYRSVKVEAYKGNVEMERKGKEKDVFEGLKLIPDDMVTTGKNGKLELMIDTDKHLVASENTCFSVDAAGNANSGRVTIKLKYGQALAKIDKKLAENSEFEIKTPNCTCSVRGTTFEVSYDKNVKVSHVEVTSGVVRVKAGDETVDLSAGESADIVDDHITTTFFFGSYEQDNDLTNGKEPIEWLVLAKKDGRMLLLSKYALDAQSYHMYHEDVTWETCTLRAWLNYGFLNDAFSPEEQKRILSTTVTADENPNPNNKSSAGNDTIDKVFLLSIAEANKYFSSDEARQCYATEYCYQLFSHRYIRDSTRWWWLRTPGSRKNSDAAVVRNGGDVWETGQGVDTDSHTIRPAIWISDDSAGE